jgi:ATP-dependent RNA helicase CshB
MSNTKFHTIRTVVMDEADMLMDASFIQEVDQLLSRLSAPQLLVFSASLSKPLLGVLRQYIRPDHVFEPTEKTVNNAQISHYLVDTRHQPILESITGFIQAIQPYRLMIFASRVATVLSVHEALVAQGLTVGLLHGDMAFRDRKAMLKRIQLGEYTIILASDIAARGMDIADVSDVLSLDLPKDLAYYFHRAGRTGRYDQLGKSYVFYQKDDQHLIDTLQQKGVQFTRMTLKADGLKTAKDTGRPFQHDEQPELKRDIKKAIQKYRTTQVKPGYKKKVKRAIERVKKKHRRAAIDKVIRKRVYGGK